MTTTQCPHHWIIATPEGPLSKGRCRLCGEEREFSNSAETHGSWTNQGRKVPEGREK